MKLFVIFSNLEHLADLLKKPISINISFDSKFLFNFHISAPYVRVLLNIELYISNFFSSYLSVHSTLFSIAVIAVLLLILLLISFSCLSSLSSFTAKYLKIFSIFKYHIYSYFSREKLNHDRRKILYSFLNPVDMEITNQILIQGTSRTTSS
jgi:hypothetical protein